MFKKFIQGLLVLITAFSLTAAPILAPLGLAGSGSGQSIFNLKYNETKLIQNESSFLQNESDSNKITDPTLGQLLVEFQGEFSEISRLLQAAPVQAAIAGEPRGNILGQVEDFLNQAQAKINGLLSSPAFAPLYEAYPSLKSLLQDLSKLVAKGQFIISKVRSIVATANAHFGGNLPEIKQAAEDFIADINTLLRQVQNGTSGERDPNKLDPSDSVLAASVIRKVLALKDMGEDTADIIAELNTGGLTNISEDIDTLISQIKQDIQQVKVELSIDLEQELIQFFEQSQHINNLRTQFNETISFILDRLVANTLEAFGTNFSFEPESFRNKAQGVWEQTMEEAKPKIRQFLKNGQEELGLAVEEFLDWFSGTALSIQIGRLKITAQKGTGNKILFSLENTASQLQPKNETARFYTGPAELVQPVQAAEQGSDIFDTGSQRSFFDSLVDIIGRFMSTGEVDTSEIIKVFGLDEVGIIKDAADFIDSAQRAGLTLEGISELDRQTAVSKINQVFQNWCQGAGAESALCDYPEAVDLLAKILIELDKQDLWDELARGEFQSVAESLIKVEFSTDIQCPLTPEEFIARAANPANWRAPVVDSISLSHGDRSDDLLAWLKWDTEENRPGQFRACTIPGATIEVVGERFTPQFDIRLGFINLRLGGAEGGLWTDVPTQCAIKGLPAPFDQIGDKEVGVFVKDFEEKGIPLIFKEGAHSATLSCYTMGDNLATWLIDKVLPFSASQSASINISNEAGFKRVGFRPGYVLQAKGKMSSDTFVLSGSGQLTYMMGWRAIRDMANCVDRPGRSFGYGIKLNGSQVAGRFITPQGRVMAGSNVIAEGQRIIKELPAWEWGTLNFSDGDQLQFEVGGCLTVGVLTQIPGESVALGDDGTAGDDGTVGDDGDTGGGDVCAPGSGVQTNFTDLIGGAFQQVVWRFIDKATGQLIDEEITNDTQIEKEFIQGAKDILVETIATSKEQSQKGDAIGLGRGTLSITLDETGLSVNQSGGGLDVCEAGDGTGLGDDGGPVPPDGGSITKGPITITPGRIDFGQVEVGQKKAKTITIENTGDETIHLEFAIINSSVSPSPFNLPEDLISQGWDLPPGATATITIEFAPQEPGTQAELQIITDHPEAGTLSVLVEGQSVETTGPPGMEQDSDNDGLPDNQDPAPNDPNTCANLAAGDSCHQSSDNPGELTGVCQEDGQGNLVCQAAGGGPGGGDQPRTGFQGPPGALKLPKPLRAQSLVELIEALVNFLIIIAVPIALIVLVVAGSYWVTAGGNQERISRGRQAIVWAVIGLVLILVAKGVISVIKTFLGTIS